MSKAPGGLTLRAIFIGLGVGSAAALSNLYVSLKTGWSLPVMSTAAMVGLTFARAKRSELHAEEAVTLTSMASAAGYMAGGGNAAAIPALVMLGGTAPSPAAMVLWFATLAILGTLFARLIGRRMVEELPFPTASATAALVVASKSETRTTRASRMLWLSALFGAAFALARSVAKIPPTLWFPGRGGSLTFGLDTSLLLMGAGGIMNPRTAASALVGALLTYGILAPQLVLSGVIAGATYREMVQFFIWPAASLLVASATTELLLSLPRILRGSAGETRGAGVSVTDWVAPAMLALGANLLMHSLFGVPWLLCLAAAPLALVMAYVASRSMGETDIVPTKALAPMAQLGLGALGEGLTGPVMGPNLTSAVALHSADTLGSLKVASLLGASPHTVFRARIAGCIVGATVVVLAYHVLVPDARGLPSTEFPAPAVMVWKSVAELVGRGTFAAPLRLAMAIGAAIGMGLSLLERFLPPRWGARVPSAMGLGSAMVLPASSTLTMFLGSVLRAFLNHRHGSDKGLAVSSGLVAGESLVGVAVQMLLPLLSLRVG